MSSERRFTGERRLRFTARPEIGERRRGWDRRTFPQPGELARMILERQPAPPVQLTRETPSSVTLTRNAKGDVQFEIKAYDIAGDEMSAAHRALEVYDMLANQCGIPPREPWSEVPH